MMVEVSEYLLLTPGVLWRMKICGSSPGFPLSFRHATNTSLWYGNEDQNVRCVKILIGRNQQDQQPQEVPGRTSANMRLASYSIINSPANFEEWKIIPIKHSETLVNPHHISSVMSGIATQISIVCDMARVPSR